MVMQSGIGRSRGGVVCLCLLLVWGGGISLGRWSLVLISIGCFMCVLLYIYLEEPDSRA